MDAIRFKFCSFARDLCRDGEKRDLERFVGETHGNNRNTHEYEEKYTFPFTAYDRSGCQCAGAEKRAQRHRSYESGEAIPLWYYA